ncbi:putative serine esterase-domain-containing protein [Glomus cerebriforme]|uniref:Putative serine esterase-domain-containing protein n=1 Tax=Glomus cerebriforme TaxID=658196 RepID=A0A397TK40_9GLOM|nr:putative serine esterase-domain-containing protein [Glomus cerebriforme]
MKEVHLVVFVHGLWGNPSHLQYLVEQFGEKHGDHVHILNAKSNSSEYTYDGINVCGDRLVEEINSEVKSLQDKPLIKVTRFSIIGYSLGGLISRYAIGILYQKKFFNSIEPVLFTTFATPHLGIRREDGTLTKVLNWVASTLLSKSGEQLVFIDKYEDDEPILLTMSRPDKIFFKALSTFKYRKLYANTRNDRTVPFWTAAISETNPFENFDELNLVTNEKFQDIVISISKLENEKQNSVIQNLTATIKKIPRYMLVAIAIPILLPLWIIFILSTITVQGILSRRRVQKILAIKADNSRNDENYSLSGNIRINVRAASLDEDAVEAAMNIKNFLTPNSPTTPVSSSNPDPFENTFTSISMSEFTSSSQFPNVRVCQAQFEAFTNLNKLKWEKFAVCLNAFNAHAAIVVRNRFQTKGKEIIKHFVEEIFVV